MQANARDYRQSDANTGTIELRSVTANLMTPARRAALEALEREFHDLIVGTPKVA